MIASLMEEQSNLIAAQELKAAREEELRRRAEEDNEDEEEIREPNSAGNDRRRGSVSSTAVCVRCKEELRAMSANGGLVKGDKELATSESGKTNETDGFKLPTKKRRIQCLYFRVMLPNLGGRRPQRDISWTFSCIRSIMFAKQIDDSMCKRTAGLFPLRIRMPEFVYAWFSPWRPLKDEKKIAEDTSLDEDTVGDDVDPNSINSSEQRRMQADEDRWCLYYGVRSLVQQGYLEAKLFLSLLDEKFGEDEQVFMLHCYRVLDVLLGGRLNWGPLRDTVSYEIFAREYAHLFPEKTGGGLAVASTRRVPKTIWISPYHASLATSVILSKATETEREALDKKILEYVVTNVPDDDRPEIYLEPKTKSWDVEPDVPHSKKRPKLGRRGKMGTEGENGDSQLPSQFVDANLWVELMMLEYKEEQAHRRAAIRLMFQTATTSATASVPESAAEISLSTMLGINYASMDMEQFRVMVHTLNDEIPSFMVATLFRNAYTRGNGTVNFDSFMDAAETWQFFSTCMRLEPPSSVVSRLFGHPFSRSPAVLNPSSRAASIVHKFFAVLGNDIGATIEELPLWTRSMTDSLAYEISSSLVEGGFSDGVRLLTLFQRLIDNLGVAKLIRRETTGCLFSSNDLICIEKALHGLLDFARHREKSSTELLIDAVRQKLSVSRVQVTFRKRLLHDQGAPHRRAERPVIWAAIADFDDIAISSAFHAGRSSLLQLTVSSALNGGIGPTPKPIFVELIYDFFVEKFGTRLRSKVSGGNTSDDSVSVASSMVGEADFVPIAVVETILQTAFSKLGSDQKMRLRIRLIAATTSNSKDSELPSEMEASSFLVFVLQEWRRYILHRLNEIRVACCEAENELVHFEKQLQLETLSNILQKVDITFTSEDLCVILRRLYITEKIQTYENDSSTSTSTTDPISDRIAAACFPLVANETLNELQLLEHAAPRPFEVKASPQLSYEFLVSTWDDYEEPCRQLLDDLRQIGKNNDIQAKALSRWPTSDEGGSSGNVLYLSSSSSADVVSSQDVAQLEAVHVLFLERLQKLTQIFDIRQQEQNVVTTAPSGGRRRSSIGVHRDGSLHLIDEAKAQETMVNETWKVFRQLFVGFVKLRAIAQLGDGALPDKWERFSV
ncbi:hypothetical protein ON010_g8184 [Phytophthora cinnamomi]|nr:hypothetical protein ON010_g8184 [Phytophthora cinnamomi]